MAAYGPNAVGDNANSDNANSDSASASSQPAPPAQAWSNVGVKEPTIVAATAKKGSGSGESDSGFARGKSPSIPDSKSAGQKTPDTPGSPVQKALAARAMNAFVKQCDESSDAEVADSPKAAKPAIDSSPKGGKDIASSTSEGLSGVSTMAPSSRSEDGNETPPLTSSSGSALPAVTLPQTSAHRRVSDPGLGGASFADIVRRASTASVNSGFSADDPPPPVTPPKASDRRPSIGWKVVKVAINEHNRGPTPPVEGLAGVSNELQGKFGRRRSESNLLAHGGMAKLFAERERSNSPNGDRAPGLEKLGRRRSVQNILASGSASSGPNRQVSDDEMRGGLGRRRSAGNQLAAGCSMNEVGGHRRNSNGDVLGKKASMKNALKSGGDIFS